MAIPNLDTTHKRLRWARETAGLSANRLSVLAGLARTHVQNIEADPRRCVNLETAKRLAQVLGLQLEWLACAGGRPPLPEEVRAAVNLAQHYPLQRRPRAADRAA